MGAKSELLARVPRRADGKRDWPLDLKARIVAEMGRLALTAGLIIQFLLFKRLHLGLGQDGALFGHRRLEPGFEVGRIVPQPDRSDTGG
ncbi:hypothetical protein DFP92_11132 [Yoonia sediminilitoris]|uniref:Uncharacterized protein n=1 Tax=Yoonia sediminilitoris TaxID=1286148 RepID=A0A2T6KAZ4_9RHOB|nr:hypothetical protein C8N45_11133 [Yoonia sediminilitoris]RCW92883.1 hypothetical protein DFP92_11132 [Yoonia sediminilitoris]